jgi:hypothetical protein
MNEALEAPTKRLRMVHGTVAGDGAGGVMLAQVVATRMGPSRPAVLSVAHQCQFGRG